MGSAEVFTPSALVASAFEKVFKKIELRFVIFGDVALLYPDDGD
jgi:hypothetical protein